MALAQPSESERESIQRGMGFLSEEHMEHSVTELQLMSGKLVVT